MGKGGRLPPAEQMFTWDEVKKHRERNDKWLVIDEDVYDITSWSSKHPGGSRVISHYAGQDATEPFRAFHIDLNFVKKYLRGMHIGRLADKVNAQEEELKQDFDALRQTVEKMGLFTPSATFFTVIMCHILLLEILAYVNMCYYGTGWGPWMLSVLMQTIVQAQAGWTQHDFGHLSVFKSSTLNHVFHMFLMPFTKGASSDWWNHLHYQHHAKPNVLHMDPDVRLDALFALGEQMPKKLAKEKKNSMPYNLQHTYFFFIGPPLLFPVFFQFMIFKHPITRGKWLDLFVVCLFYVKTAVLYFPLLGVFGCIKFYFTFRCLESTWFTWVSQSNHIPMEIAEDTEKPWLPLQLNATCDVEKSFFNDWFTGHLNHQIEHHLFPTMPRHNLYKVAPLVQSLCAKHHIPYKVKPLTTAFCDIIRSLKHSGQIWKTARDELQRQQK